MTLDIRPQGTAGRPLGAAYSGDGLGTSPELPTMRCADAARVRGERIAASAVRYHRFLLLEVPGPWGKSALDDRHMDAAVAGQLTRAAAATGTHVLLIRRPGRHPAFGSDAGQRVMAWAFADTSPGAERVLWGAWRDPADLLNLDLTASIPGEANAAASQRLALVCTNGKRDQCCALRGRPVAAALAAAGWDTWECSHLGGHRFAATLMVLPTGDMFGWLDAASAPDVLRRFDGGELDLSHHRGRAGQPAHVQAALQAAAVRLGEFRRDAFQVIAVRRSSPVPAKEDNGWPAGPGEGTGRWQVELIHRTERSPGTAYRVIVTGSPLAPSFLSCADSSPKAEIQYEALSLTHIR
jgi:hypothetical protein